MSTTNTDKPFKPGERIAFCEEEFIVVANHGTTGTVREPGSKQAISPFYWHFDGEDCRRVTPVTA